MQKYFFGTPKDSKRDPTRIESRYTPAEGQSQEADYTTYPLTYSTRIPGYLNLPLRACPAMRVLTSEP
jgi:hypothetical protein